MTTQDSSGAAAIPQPEVVDADEAGRRRVDAQWALMPEGWRRLDRRIIVWTQWLLCVVGVAFAAMITLEVVSRYVFSFSIYFVNAAARLLLVWFFTLGAGIAMRHGAHVGFELLLSALPWRARRAVVLAGLGCTAVFCVEMIYAGIVAAGPAWSQSEPGLGISLLWPMLAIPVGFALLLYHTAVIIWIVTHAPEADRP
ncbi:MAG TPA: TRAP transporter small permease [Casimicrobiaceae bacterium]|nr:TRAP transporter small permease [Casimicrobiaceae bacterium]